MATESVSQEWLDQLDHERMKAFMEEHGWSTRICADPANLYEIKLEEEDSEIETQPSRSNK